MLQQISAFLSSTRQHVDVCFCQIVIFLSLSWTTTAKQVILSLLLLRDVIMVIYSTKSQAGVASDCMIPGANQQLQERPAQASAQVKQRFWP